MTGIRVGVDAWGVTDDSPTDGMTHYATSLLRGLPLTGCIELVAYGAPGAYRPGWLHPDVEWRSPPRGRVARLDALQSRLCWLPTAAAADRLDAFHAPGVHVRPSFPPIPQVPCPLLVTVHDVIPISYYTGTLPTRNRLFYRWNLRRAATADQVLTVSEAALVEITRWTTIPPERISVVTSAVTFLPNHDRQAVMRLGLGSSPYVLFAGSYEPRKNLIGALHAFDRFADDAPHHFVAVTEADSGHARAAHQALASMRHQDRVHLVHDVPDAELRSLYTHAGATLFPSRAEGLGLPAIQSAACGIPVVVSDLPVYAESIGDVAIVTDTEDAGRFAGAIRLAVGERARCHAARHGPTRATRYSPYDHANQHVRLYEGVAEGQHANA
jgi:glycosyltransferase involved in cell wall biosynthesis